MRVQVRLMILFVYYSYRLTYYRLLPILAVGLSPNTPPQVDARPISNICRQCFGRGRALVRTSAVCWGSWQVSILISFCSTRSRTQCHQMAICLLWLWNCWFFTIAIDPSLSPLIVIGNSCGIPSSLYKFLSQQASRAASDNATYLASVNESAMVVCFLDFQVIAPPDTKKT